MIVGRSDLGVGLTMIGPHIINVDRADVKIVDLFSFLFYPSFFSLYLFLILLPIFYL